MIVYFDTSAFVPLLIDEAATKACTELWYSADTVLSTRLLYVEASSALARARRAGRLSADAHADAIGLCDELWRTMAVSELDEPLMVRAGEFANEYGLRGYDSVHCAAAAMAGDQQLVAASGDTRLLAAWRSLGLATVRTTAR